MLPSDNITFAYDWEQDSDPENPVPAQAAQKVSQKKGKKDYVKKSMDSFPKLDHQAILDAHSFTYHYGDKEDERIKWKILSEEKQIVQCPMD